MHLYKNFIQQSDLILIINFYNSNHNWKCMIIPTFCITAIYFSSILTTIIVFSTVNRASTSKRPFMSFLLVFIGSFIPVDSCILSSAAQRGTVLVSSISYDLFGRRYSGGYCTEVILLFQNKTQSIAYQLSLFAIYCAHHCSDDINMWSLGTIKIIGDI